MVRSSTSANAGLHDNLEVCNFKLTQKLTSCARVQLPLFLKPLLFKSHETSGEGSCKGGMRQYTHVLEG